METPLERLARINKNLNVALSQVQENDLSFKPICSSSNLGRSRSVVFDKNWVHYIEDRYANVEDGLFRKTGVTAISKVLMNVSSLSLQSSAEKFLELSKVISIRTPKIEISAL